MFRRSLIAMAAIALFVAGSVGAQDSIEGRWSGLIAGQLEMIFNVTATDEGYASTLDVPLQNLKDHPMDSTTFDGTTLRIEFDTIGGVYEGELQEDGTIAGNWSQTAAPAPQPLNLERQSDDS